MGPRFSGLAVRARIRVRDELAITGQSVMAASRQYSRWGRGLDSKADVDPEVWTMLDPGVEPRFVTWGE